MGYISIKKSFKSMGMLRQQPVHQNLVKGEKSYLAMQSRCYDGSIKTLKRT
jgi:cobalt/nickel transport system permease protein